MNMQHTVVKVKSASEPNKVYRVTLAGGCQCDKYFFESQHNWRTLSGARFFCRHMQEAKVKLMQREAGLYEISEAIIKERARAEAEAQDELDTLFERGVDTWSLEDGERVNHLLDIVGHRI